MVRILNARYIASAVRKDQYPDVDLPQIAMIGRSNVGKSSLINSLCDHRGLARVSGTPGKTQTLNFYQVNIKVTTEPNQAEGERRESFLLVDLPGYGYARRSRESRTMWSKFIEEYLIHSPQLCLVVQLIDSRHPVMENDAQSVLWIQQHNLPLQLVATKTDKLSKNMLARQLRDIQMQLGATGKVLAYSALSGAGRSDLLGRIETVLLGHWAGSFTQG